MIQTHKDLIVWQKSVELCLRIYKTATHFPKEELYGLSSQIKRASISIPSNIAEGRSRGTRKDFCAFLRVARGSCAEVQTQLELSFRLGFMQQKDYLLLDQNITEILMMLNGMIKKLKADS